MVARFDRATKLVCTFTWLAGLAACSDAPTVPAPVEDAGAAPADAAGQVAHQDMAIIDAGSVAPVPEPEVLLGTGQFGFEPVTDGQVLPLVHGTQGLQHVWIALRVRDFDPDRAIIVLGLERERDGLSATEPFRVRIPFVEEPGGAYVERLGIQLVVLDPNVALGEPLVLTAGVENPLGAHATASAHVAVMWEENL